MIHQGALGDCMYIVMHGRLKVYRHLSRQAPTFIKEIGPKEIVGEISLLIQETRTSSVRAVRDSILLKFPQELFQSFVLKHPDILLNFSRICINRLLHPIEKASSPFRTILLAPGAINPLFKEFTTQFIKALSVKANILYLSSSSAHPNLQSTMWLAEQELLYDYVIYEADLDLTPWTHLCLRQSDHVLFIGLSSQSPELNSIESYFFKTQAKRASSYELILLQQNAHAIASSTELWTQSRHNASHQHICLSSAQDLEKLIRFLSGKSIGLVLSGGGARGLAHVGVIRALEELKIPIDYIAGTSMGAIIGASYAKGLSYKEILHQLKTILIPTAKTLDYTLPILSLKSGKKFSLGLQQAFGETFEIKDCKTNFFCISTNLSESKIKLHKEGMLWECLRASAAVPALFPPIINEMGEILVDGGILNNMPVDIMKNYLNGGKTLAVSISSGKERTHYSPLEAWVSGWQLLADQFSKEPMNSKTPNIGELIMETINLSGDQHQVRMEKEADYCLSLDLSLFSFLDFHSYEKIIEIGYKIALEQLQKEFS